MALPESKQDFKKSRVYYTTADTATQTIVQLAGGTFLATIMAFCGISDANIGIITSLLSFAALTQLFLINFFKRLKKYKLLVCITAFQRFLFAFLYLVPLLPVRNGVKAVLIVMLYLIGQIFVQIGLPASQDWIASLVPSRLRGKYFSIKDSIAVFVVSSVMLAAGMVLDYFKNRNLIIGFEIIFAMIFILTVINVYSFSKMKEPKFSYMTEDGKEMHGRLARKARDYEKTVKQKEVSIYVEVKEALSNRKFRKAFTIQCLYITAFYISLPFNASYQINELALPYTFIMLIGFIANLYRIVIMPKLGRLADRYGMARLLRYTLFALGLYCLSMAFTVPSNAYFLFIIGSFLSATAWAFLGIGLFGVQLDYYKSEKRMIWLTITSSLSGLLGFMVSLVGGYFLSLLQRADLHLMGMKLYAQQVLNMAGFLIILFSVFYIKYHIETEKIDTNRSDGRI